MTKTTDRMLVDVQRVAIELEECRRENEHLRILHDMAKESAEHNADLYEQDMKFAQKTVRDFLHGRISSANIVSTIRIRREEGLKKLKSTRRGWIKEEQED